MSKEEKLKVYVRLIEDAGGMVLMQEDIVLNSDVEDNYTKPSPLAPLEIGNDTEIIKVDVVPAKKEEEKLVLEGEEDDFFDISEPIPEKVLVKKSIDEDDFEI